MEKESGKRDKKKEIKGRNGKRWKQRREEWSSKQGMRLKEKTYAKQE